MPQLLHGREEFPQFPSTSTRGLGSNVGVAFDSQDKNHPVVKEVQVHGAGSMSISASQILDDEVYGGLTEMWNSTCLPEQTVKAQYPQLFLNS